MICIIKVKNIRNWVRRDQLGLVYGADYTDDFVGKKQLVDRVDFSILGNDEERYYPNRRYVIANSGNKGQRV